MTTGRGRDVVADRGRRAAILGVLVPCVLALSLVTACGTGATDQPPGGPRQTGGISREEYCAGRPVIVRITAQQERAAVVVRWRELFESRDDRTFRVYRRSGPDARWSRVAEVELPPGKGGSWLDPSHPPSRTTQYGVTQVTSTCGEDRLCAGTPPWGSAAWQR